MNVALQPVTVVCVGKMKNPQYRSLLTLYIDRLKHDLKITLKIVTDSDITTEGQQIITLLHKMNSHSFALAEEGKLFSSYAFAAFLSKKNRPLTFIIGGPSGLSDPVKKNADNLLSLSPMTFTHEMARVLLVEQLYRACSILNHRAYHKE